MDPGYREPGIYQRSDQNGTSSGGRCLGDFGQRLIQVREQILNLLDAH